MSHKPQELLIAFEGQKFGQFRGYHIVHSGDPMTTLECMETPTHLGNLLSTGWVLSNIYQGCWFFQREAPQTKEVEHG